MRFSLRKSHLFRWTLFFLFSLANETLCQSTVECIAKELSNPNLVSATVKSLSSIRSKLNGSKRIIFFDGETYRRIKDSDLFIGASFTVNIEHRFLVIGKNIPGRDGKIGASGSHIKLQNQFDSLLNNDPAVFERFQTLNSASSYGSGAIKINAQEGIDVSGFTLQQAHLNFAENIQKILTEIMPGVSTRITGGRLNQLPPL